MGKGIVSAIMGDSIDQDAYVDREALLYAVQRHMFCQKTRVILDVRRAVLVELARDGATIATMIVSVEAFDDASMGMAHVRATAEHFGASYKVIDGRDYTAKGTLTVKARRRIEAELADAALADAALADAALADAALADAAQ